jgi:hypothetical protein
VRLSRARLLKRVSQLNLEHCPNCGGPLKVNAAVLEGDRAARRHGSWGWAAPGVCGTDGTRLMTRAKSQTTPKRDGFRLRCQLGRECSAQEKADVLAWLLTRQP